MLHRTPLLAVAALLLALAATPEAKAWGCYHAGYHYGAYGGGYRAGYTHWGPYTGLEHVGVGGYRYGGYGGYGGYHYGGYHYGGYGGYGGYRAGYVRRW